MLRPAASGEGRKTNQPKKPGCNLSTNHHAYDASNFDTVLSVWDRFFRTLAPPLPEENPPGFGVTPFLAERYARPHRALLLPFALQVETPNGRSSL
jgi:hypothetical protein